MVDVSSLKSELDGEPVAVFGLGISGLSTAKALIDGGIEVHAWDDKKENCQKAKELGAVITDLTQESLEPFAFLLLAPGVPYTFEPHKVVLNAQKYDTEIIGDLELLHRCRHGLKTIGITGTNGKSTTTALMVHVLNECGLKAVMGGNIGKPVFDLDLSDKDTILVLEISSYQMDLCPTFRPDISILLNITSDHLDRHGSMKNYVEAKARILEGTGVAFIGVDDDFTQELFNRAFFNGERKVYPFSVTTKITEGYYAANNILYRNRGGEDIEIGALDNLETLKGNHNQQNILSVYAVAKTLDINDSAIFKALKTFPGLPHRQYLVTKENNVAYVNDSKATNAEAAAKALASYDNIFWIAGGRPKKGGLEGLEIFKDKVRKAYLIGEAAKEFSVWLKKNGFEYEICKTLDKAVTKARKDAEKAEGEAVVLLSPACASWDQYTSFEKRGEAFEQKIFDLLGKKAA
jgi:UDP-N-acetylmuramoylalanine--D-glutamate ligase